MAGGRSLRAAYWSEKEADTFSKATNRKQGKQEVEEIRAFQEGEIELLIYS
jgi:hypothetical protein